MLWYFYVGCDVCMFVWWLKCYGYVNLFFYKYDIVLFFYLLGDMIVLYLWKFKILSLCLLGYVESLIINLIFFCVSIKYICMDYVIKVMI